jgi:hypothetical protein
MQEYQIPKVRVQVEGRLDSGAPFRGHFYLSENTPQQSGRQRLEDFLNQDKDFLPLVLPDGGFHFINKRQITYLLTSELDRNHFQEELLLQPIAVALTFHDGEEMAVEALPDLPEGRRRASDFMNQPSQFLAVYRGAEKTIINKHLVLFFREASDGGTHGQD